MSWSPITYKRSLEAISYLAWTPIDAIMKHELFNIKGDKFMPRTRICGIYAIINQVNAHRYIGSSCNINKRWSEHRYHLRKGKHKSGYLQKAWDNYGESNFVFTILEIVESPDLLQEREQHYMDFFLPEYNVYPFAFSAKNRTVTEAQKEHLRQLNTGKKPTPEARENHRLAMNRPEVIEANRQRALRRKDSPETRAKKSAAQLIAQNRPEQLELNRQKHLGKKMPREGVIRSHEKLKGHKRSPETIARIRAARTPENSEAGWEKRRANKQGGE